MEKNLMTSEKKTSAKQPGNKTATHTGARKALAAKLRQIEASAKHDDPRQTISEFAGLLAFAVEAGSL